jgi:hypothetical protein
LLLVTSSLMLLLQRDRGSRVAVPSFPVFTLAEAFSGFTTK